MNRPTLIINAVDFTAYAHKRGYSIEYESREGQNGGVLQDGTLVVDLLARKPVITWALNDLTSDKLAQLLTICEDRYVSVTYFDTRKNADATAVFHPNVSPQVFALTTPQGVKWFKELVLTLRAR